ncbi:hypothetical protein D770_25675 [Flammeovirgaceae bacterium 311]|nr:hypothetical protein D770_04145 [Flammeovirgaceae bacterium 311]AHM59103.1 hypothetical protein D770_04180 [Flammeovirgaceae bacterium 311]AHM63380.1 hypothetical protein D770_25675 [Flammeovirgaceae bacterium 311]
MRLRHLFICCLIIQACSPDKSFIEEKAIKYSYVNYQIELVSEVLLTVDTTKYLFSVSDSIYTLKYINPKDTVSYILRADSIFQPIYITNAKDTSDSFIYVAHLDFKINDRLYRVFKYASDPGVIDGCVTHFWTPELGIILTRSSTWRSFSKLQTNSDSINQQINLLAEVIYQDASFYNGCNKEMELMPKADAEEYYKQKYKDSDVGSEINKIINDR